MARQLPRLDVRAARTLDVDLGLDAAQGSDLALVVAWLTRLHLLYGVPFNYLVPDERMLPVESLRFFQVDANWMDALLDGAWSLGFAGVSSTVSQAARPRVMAAARTAAPDVRQAALSSSRRLAASARAAPAEMETDVVDGGGAVSGFLLRSAVVAGWPGLEVRGFADTAKTQRLAILRLEAIAPSLLLCLFDGTVAAVELREPAEALHFGVDAGTEGFTKELRYAAGSSVGTFTGASVPVPLRSATTGVVNVSALAASMAGAVWPSPRPAGTSFTAAEFALEMVEGVQVVDFARGNPPVQVAYAWAY